MQESLGYKEIKPVSPKVNQPSTGRTDAEAPILGSPDMKGLLIRKDPDAGKDRGRKRREQRTGWLGGIITNTMDMSLSKLQEMEKDREAWHAAAHWVTKSQTQSVTEQQQQIKFTSMCFKTQILSL